MTSDESDSPTKEPAEDPPPPGDGFTAPARPGLRAILTWIAIAVCVVMIVATGEQTAENRESEAAGLTLRSAGRYAVGVNRIVAKLGPGTSPIKSFTDSLAAQLDANASSPADRLYVLPVFAELRGAKTAIERLDKMRFGSDEADLQRDAEALRVIYEGGPDELGDGEKERLVERMGWFGQLAVSWGRPDSDPDRQAAIEPAMRTAVGAFITVPLVLLAGAAGFALLIGAMIRFRAGKMPTAGTTDLAHRWGANLLVEGFAIYLAMFVLMQALSRVFPTGRLSLLSIALYALAPLASLWPLAQGMRFSELRSRLGWHRGQGLLKEIGWGAIGYVAGLPIMGAGILLTLVLSKLGHTQPSHPISEWITWDFWRIVALLALAAVWAPLSEETMFRGALYAGVRGRRGRAASAAIVAFIFAAIHPQGWAAIPVLMSIALVLAMLREWRGSLIASITAHAINNAVVVIAFALVAG